jgi:hypothetical protein
LTLRRKDLHKGDLWIGLAKVEHSGPEGFLGDAKGAYTNAVAMADGKENFRSSVVEALADLGLRLIRLEGAEPLEARKSKYSIDQELTEVAEEASNTGHVGFGAFHAFDA